MNEYQPEEFKDLQKLYNAQIEFADKLGNAIENSQDHIRNLEQEKRKLIEIASKLADPNMTINTFQDRRQEFIDLVTEIE